VYNHLYPKYRALRFYDCSQSRLTYKKERILSEEKQKSTSNSPLLWDRSILLPILYSAISQLTIGLIELCQHVINNAFQKQQQERGREKGCVGGIRVVHAVASTFRRPLLSPLYWLLQSNSRRRKTSNEYNREWTKLNETFLPSSPFVFFFLLF